MADPLSISIDPESVTNIFIMVVSYALVAFGVGAAVWYGWKKRYFHNYPINVGVLEVRKGGALVWDADKMRRIMTKNNKGESEFMELQKRGDKLPAMAYDNFIQKKGKGQIVFLLETSKGHYKILSLTEIMKLETLKFDMIETEAQSRSLKTVEDRRDMLKWTHEDALTKLMPIIMIGVVAVSIGLLYYFTFEYGINPQVARIGGIAESQAQLTEVTSKTLDKAAEFLELAMEACKS